ncbi:secretory pathway Sec39 [Pseudovirgaria hyperparasitica]|uniref:Secretory pathway Sec39 n=1 Tax=Pseudovirgaria hyperparasitica TaxID=470096 RepID=A0A6A6W541_9PEZI|nr:secretory pathway Sec39 [Pseudovirgaria hyperparasitica]KAF2757992.1 secretory pathway Sec39 [Pseudovirgaria hyperparasitica]
MDTLQHLSPPKCVLLAIRYASDANIPALRAVVRARHTDLSTPLVLRIILTYLPESIDPSAYVPLCSELISGQFDTDSTAGDLDFSALNGVSDKKARSKVNKAQLLPLPHYAYTHEGTDDLTNFLIHRAHRIHSETGLFDLVPKLVAPFLEYSQYLKTWFISACLPLLRQEYEYYPDHAVESSLDSFVTLGGTKAINLLLSRALKPKPGPTRAEAPNNIARDIRGLVGPWVYGSSDRKRRKITNDQHRHAISAGRDDGDSSSLDTAQAQDWDYAFKWLVEQAAANFTVVIAGIEEWDGPGDVDLGGYEQSPHYLTEDSQRQLEQRYAQAAFATAYAVEADTADTISGAHSLLVRLASLMDFEPPPDLATSVEMLPKIEDATSIMHNTSPKALSPDSLLDKEHPLTSPNIKTFALLQIFIYSAYTLANLGYSMSIKNVAHMRFHSEEDEQTQMLQKILHGAGEIVGKESHKWSHKWEVLRKQLIWLWNWGLVGQKDAIQEGFGIFGKIKRENFEREILRAFLNGGQYELVLTTYVKQPREQTLSLGDVENVILEVALQYYDTASNGNRTRGNMKKVSTIIATFQPHFPRSDAFKRTEALLSATHSLSFYSLTQQRGVPFQPVSIRIRSDPLSLINDLLEQNPSSYTKLDDLMEIGCNLIAAGVGAAPDSLSPSQSSSISAQKEATEQRVLGMTIEASLREDDFETAYSYVVNRMPGVSTPDPTNADTNTGSTKDTSSWRAAFIAGRHSTPSSSATLTSSAHLRRLEQRMDLLSQSLLAAPPSALAEILSVYMEVEAEMNECLAREQAEEESWDDHADHRLPGAFAESVHIQPRREVGRGAVEEAPMGLFDVARGAAAAFSRTAGMGAKRAAGQQQQQQQQQQAHERDMSTDSVDMEGSEEMRVRKRDMLASTVTGGSRALASGLGWVLGATPVHDEQPR